MKTYLLLVLSVCCAFAGVAGETLYNGIVLSKEWPPRIDPKDQNPIKAPYLEADNIPKVIPIDLGRQLFVDDFLIESTTGIETPESQTSASTAPAAASESIGSENSMQAGCLCMEQAQ